MALEKQTKSLPFVEGPDTKTDPKLSAKPAAIFNSVFAAGSISKRPGRDLLPSAVAGGGTQTKGEAITAFNQELFRINGGVAYGLAEATDQWVMKQGGNNYCQTSLRSMVNMPGSVGTFDHCIIGNIGVVAWCQSGMRVMVYDVQTGVIYQDGAAKIAGSASDADLPRLVALGQKAVLLWFDFHAGPADLYSAVIDTTAPTVIPTQALIRTDVENALAAFDAIAYSPSLAVVAYPSDDVGQDKVTLIGVDATGAVTASPAPTIIDVGAAGSATGGILLARDTAGNIYLVFGDASAAQKTAYVVRSATFASVLGITNIVTNGNWSSGTAIMAMGSAIEMTANRLTLILCNSPPNVASNLGTAVVSAAGITTAFSELLSTTGLSLLGDLVPYDGTAVFAVVNADGPSGTDITGLQSSAFVLNLAGLVVAKGLPYETTWLTGSFSPRVCRSFVSGQTAKFLFWQQGRLAYQSTSATATSASAARVVEVTPLGIVQLSVTNSGAQPLPLVRVGQSLYIGGGYPRTYDGRLLGETGFSLYPDIVAVSDSGAGNLSAGAYQWVFLYSWRGANGELTRGPPSPPHSLTLAASKSADLVISEMPLAMRDLIVAGGNTLIEIYRTEANGTVFHRQSSVITGPQNSTGSPLVQTIVDDTSDADLVFGELLYTTGGVLDWEAPPAYSAACAHKNRLVVLPSEDPYSWMPSSEWSPGETVRFSSLTVNRVPSDKGPLTGVASMDGKLILFAEKGAFVVIGDGPDLFGANNYPPPERIASVDAGPIPQTPIVETPLGLMYQSDAGIQLLDRGLNRQFVGSDVEAFSEGLWTLRAATLDPENLQVRFLLDAGSDLVGALLPTMTTSVGGVSLVFNYFYNQWAIWANYGGQAATFYQGRYTMVRSDGVVWQESPTSFRDAGAYYESLTETPWLKLAGLQGYQRLWYVTLLGTYGSDFTLVWEVAYNYAGTSPTEPVWTTIETLDGAGVFDVGGPFRVRQHIGHKCEAIKFRIRDSNLSGNGAGMALTDLTLEIGVRKGAFKLPASQTSREG